MSTPDVVMLGYYDTRLVALSVLIAVVASYAALDLAERVTSARGGPRYLWLSGGAAAMGIGIWSMHYIGMLAFRLPVPVQYDWPTVLASLLAAILASLVALFVVSRNKMGPLQALVGCIIMGGGIASMHYIGMAAMRLPAMCHYSPAIVAFSVILAFVISLVALWLTFRFRGETTPWGWRKLVSALVMGAAIPVMHYTGMAAASFTPSTLVQGDLSHALSISSLGIVSIVVVTFMVLGVSLLTSLADRRFSAKALELESSERRYHQILESALDAFVAMDASGVITDWNAQAEITFGWQRSEVLGQLLSERIIPHRYHEVHAQGLQHFFALGEGPVLNKRIEITALHRGEREFPIELTMLAMNEGGTRRFSAFARDITLRKRSEQEILDAKEAAEQSNQAKSEFLANMSHEIRTPMNGILGMTELVLDTHLSSEQRDSLGLVKLSAESLLSIINDVLDFSKIEAGKLDMESIPFEMRESLGEGIEALSCRANQKGLELVYEVQPDVPEALIGDPGRIRQIIVNLVGNAIKFTEHGEIFVSVEKESETPDSVRLHFAIKDTGVGIPENKQRKIFEAFSQADGSMARVYGGTGLGLTICTRLVGMMDGRIWVESEVDKGSTFHFTVALGIQQDSSSRSSHSHIESARLRDMHVLIVDDNFTNRRVLHGILSRWGMKPTAVDGGRAALETIEGAKNAGFPFPLILLDGQMPEMDGFTLAERIHKDSDLVNTNIMMLTSAGRLGDAARCRELGIGAYLMKPIRQGELLNAICGMLDGRAQKKAEPLVTPHIPVEEKHRIHILLAEDNAINQTLAVRLLEKRGYSVTVAPDGQAAVEAFQKGEFELVLMDIQMPRMDGFEATASIREKEKLTGGHIPIVAMTAHALVSDQVRCLASGMDGYVSKPIRISELFSTIERILGNKDCAPADDSGNVSDPVVGRT